MNKKNNKFHGKELVMSKSSELIAFIDDWYGGLEQYEQIKKRVIRGGKVQVKLQCKPGYKAVGNKCVKISAQELRARKMGARKAKIKKKGKSKAAQLRARAISMKRRKGMGL